MAALNPARYLVVFFTGLLGLANAGLAADEDRVAEAGEGRFIAYCGACHGSDGRGNGPVANYLTEKSTDLTQLSRNNDGNFPFWRVYNVIDGREKIGSHGSREMPVWGDVFQSQASAGLGRETMTRGRILELIVYLRSIQE